MITEVNINMNPIPNGNGNLNVCRKRPRLNRASPVALRDFEPAGTGTGSFENQLKAQISVHRRQCHGVKVY
jgi:hypothetical protein